MERAGIAIVPYAVFNTAEPKNRRLTQEFSPTVSGAVNFCAAASVNFRRSIPNGSHIEEIMSPARPANTDLERAFGEAKTQARNIAGEASDAAQNLYDTARDKATNLADSANDAARQTAGSFERALRNTIETQPYAAVAIALGLGWLFGRIHRPL